MFNRIAATMIHADLFSSPLFSPSLVKKTSGDCERTSISSGKSISSEDGLHFFFSLVCSYRRTYQNSSQGKSKAQLLNVLWGGQGWCVWQRGWGKGWSCPLSRSISWCVQRFRLELSRGGRSQGCRAAGHSRSGRASRPSAPGRTSLSARQWCCPKSLGTKYKYK